MSALTKILRRLRARRPVPAPNPAQEPRPVRFEWGNYDWYEKAKAQEAAEDKDASPLR
jgi:hypothetical protein